MFRVHKGSDTGSWRSQRNSLPQGSVLAPTLLNLYTNDLPVTCDWKFIYADDICLTVQTWVQVVFRSDMNVTLLSTVASQVKICQDSLKCVSPTQHKRQSWTVCVSRIDGQCLRHATKESDRTDGHACWLQILKEEITPTLTKLKEDRSSFLEYQKVIRELEHLNKLYIAYKFVCAEVSTHRLLMIPDVFLATRWM